MIPESPALGRATTHATLRVESTPIKDVQVKLKNNAIEGENTYYTDMTLTRDPGSHRVTYPTSVTRDGVQYNLSRITVNNGPNEDTDRDGVIDVTLSVGDSKMVTAVYVPPPATPLAPPTPATEALCEPAVSQSSSSAKPLFRREDLMRYDEVKKWASGKGERTMEAYMSGLQEYVKFTGLNPTELIDEVEEDRKKTRRHRGVPEGRLKEFHSYILKGYKQKNGKNKGKTGLSEKRARLYFTAVKSFYETNGFELDVKTPKAAPKKVNFKLIIRPKEVRELLNWCSNIRDKAIILAMFQGGKAVAELCALDYGDVARELEEGITPLHLHIIRKKENVEYDTYLGKDTADALRLYKKEREMRGEKLAHTSPLFIKDGMRKLKAQRITPRLVEITLKKLALKSGLVSESEMEAADMNPARPHAFRTAFISILKLAGCNDMAVEYMAGHKLDEVQTAYWRTRTEELMEMYSRYERYLSVFGTSAPASGARQAILEEIADLMGIDLELVKSEVGKQLGRKPEDSEVESFLKEKIRQKINGSRKEKEQRVIEAEDVQKYLDDGWEVQFVMSPSKIIVCREKRDRAIEH